MFNRSLLKVLDYRPWRWTTEPVYGNGPMQPPTVEGVKETLPGVFVLASQRILDFIKDGLTTNQKNTVEGWKKRFKLNPTEEEKAAGWLDAAEWHIPLWAGQTQGTYINPPTNVWADKDNPPTLIKTRFKNLYIESSN